MDRRAFVSAAAGILALPLAVQAQQKAGRIYRLGILSLDTRPALGTGLPEWLATTMRDLGYMDGQNLLVEARYADHRSDQLPALARELVQLKPDVIVAIGTPATQAGKSATTAVPIVFLSNVDPVAAKLVASLARPGGNITGVMITPECSLAEKRVELLKEWVPRATRIALLTPDSAGNPMNLQVQEVRKAAASLGVELIVVEAQGGDYAKAFAVISAARSAAVIVAATSRFVRDRKQIIKLAASHRLPAIYEWPGQVKDGGLMSYGASDTETYRRVAVYVDRIFNGAQPSELPMNSRAS